MNVLLVNPVVRKWAMPNCTPLGLLYIAAELKRLGHSVEIYDCNALRPSDEEIKVRLGEKNYNWVGLTGIITTYAEVKKLAQMSKAVCPERPVVLGGALASTIPYLVASKIPEIDFIVEGEGERVLPDLLKEVALWEHDPDGAMMLKAKRPTTNLNDLPDLDRSRVPMQVYLSNPIGAYNKRKWTDGVATSLVKGTNFMAGRGCPYSCTYCAHDFMGTKYRVRSARHVVDELKWAWLEFGIGYAHFVDDEFCASREFVEDFCDELRRQRQGTGIEWGCTGRVNLVGPALLENMASAGCIHMSFGVESGSQKILDSMKKHVEVEKAEFTLQLAKSQIQDVATTYMVGYPGETEETLQETVRFIQKVGLKPDAVFYCTPYPGTELYRMALDSGRIPDEEAYILSLDEQGRKIALNMSGLPDEVLTAYKVKMENLL